MSLRLRKSASCALDGMVWFAASLSWRGSKLERCTLAAAARSPSAGASTPRSTRLAWAGAARARIASRVRSAGRTLLVSAGPAPGLSGGSAAVDGDVHRRAGLALGPRGRLLVDHDPVVLEQRAE